MRKIYTTTFQNADNYGAILQCYALNKFLSKKYDTYVIDYNNKIISNPYNIIRNISKNPIKKTYHFIIDILNLKDSKERKENFEKFRKKINFTKSIKKIEELKYNENDVFITGSDQVWNIEITKKLDDIYFLNFKNCNCKKISYAASCGDISTLSKSGNELEFKDRINKLDAISVRETDLANYISENIQVKPKVVLDPVFLLNKEDWFKLIGKKRLIKDKYIFVYSVANANKLFYKTIEKLSKETGLKIVYFNKKILFNNYKVKSERWYKAGPIEFLNLLYYSEYVITTSFHGTAFSSIFNKKLFIILIANPERILTLINNIGLKNRIVKHENDINKILNNNIDWNKVNIKLDKEKLKSQNWLINAIEGNRK